MAASRPNAALHEDEIEWCWPWSDEESRQDLDSVPPTFTFPATNLDVIVELALGADLTADPDTWVWTDISTYVRHADRIVISRGRGDEWTEVGPSRATLTLDNRDGRFTRVNVFGTWYGQLQRNTPLRIRVDMHTGAGPQTRFTGYVTKWPPRWDKSGNNQWTPITADGIFRRLGQGDPLRSAMYRSISGVIEGDLVPIAYWPMEDGANATQFASGLADGPVMRFTGSVAPATASDLVGSDPLPNMAVSSSMLATIPSHTDTGFWAVQVVVKIPSEPASTTTLIEIKATGGTTATYRLVVVPGTPASLFVNGFDAAGAPTYTVVEYPLDGASGRPTEADFFGTWHMIFISSQDDRAVDPPLSSTTLSISTTNGTGISPGELIPGTGETLAGGVHSKVSTVKIIAGVAISVGHLAVSLHEEWKFLAVPHMTAMVGHAGEQAHERIARLCSEERLPYSITGTRSAAMGAQTTSKLLDLIREAEKTDVGILYETLDGRVGYRTNSDRYNRDALLTLDYNLKHIREWAPQDDDQKIKNDITVSRPGGSSARLEDAASIAKEGRYRQPHTANVETDSQLTHVAGWLRHLGTFDELRFPQVGFQLHRHTSLINAWLAQDLLTHRLDIINLPTPVPVTTRQAIEGYTETIGSRDWDIDVNLAPVSTYTVAVYDDGLSRYGAANTKLTSAITSSQTSVAVTATDETWITTATFPAEFPINVDIGGLTYSCTAITGTTPSYTLTLVRLGTDKAHAANAAVTITDTGRYGL